MAADPFLFDAVLFDLDGTLVATERYWPEAARAGARRAFDELGLDRPMPTDTEWMSMVGLPLDAAFERVLGDLDRGARAVVMERCREEEHRLIDRGHVQPLPGALELLRELRAAGVALGIASNCTRDYLEEVTRGAGLAELVDERRCLHSPGVADKADMIADLLATFGTRSAVMVGDREADARAAHANGVPHVHVECGYAGAERFACEGRASGIDGVGALLRGRAAALRQALESTGVPEPLPAGVDPGTGPRRAGAGHGVGITGPPGAGKSLLARDVVRLLAAEGRPAAVAELDTGEGGSLARLVLGAGPAAGGRRPSARGPSARGEGPALLLAVAEDPADLPPGLDAVLRVEVDREIALRRLAARAAAERGPVRAREEAAARWSAAGGAAAGPDPAARHVLCLDGGDPFTLGLPGHPGPGGRLKRPRRPG